MRYSNFAASLLSLSLPIATTAIKAPNVDGMKTVWSEDFKGCQGCKLNTEDWVIASDIDTNSELQVYTSDSKNLQLSGGETVQLVPWKTKDGHWSSARIETKGSWNPAPGKAMRFQARLLIGANADKQGMWPAFWMLGDAIHHGTQWPLCGEIDIFEQVNGAMSGYGTIHCDSEKGGACNEPEGRGKDVPIPNNDFHDWAVTIDRTSNNWETETLTWTIDGQPFHTVSGADLGDKGVWATLAHSPMYMLLNVAVGGSWPGDPNASTEDGYGSMMEVAYVAVYETA